MAPPTPLPGDFHTHTFLCHHAEGRAVDYVRAGLAAGLESVAITDHCPSPHGYDPENRMTMADLEAYTAMVEEARSAHPGHVLWGFETDYYQGCHYFQSTFLNERDLDFTLGAIHYQNFWAPEESERGLFAKSEAEHVWRRYFKLLALAASSGLYQIMAHFDLPKRKGAVPKDAFLAEVAQPALDAIARAGVAIEINTSGRQHPVHDFYPSGLLLQMACARGIPIVFGSDAHRPEDTGRDFAEAVAFAKRAGYRERAVFEKRRARMVPL